MKASLEVFAAKVFFWWNARKAAKHGRTFPNGHLRLLKGVKEE